VVIETKSKDNLRDKLPGVSEIENLDFMARYHLVMLFEQEAWRPNRLLSRDVV